MPPEEVDLRSDTVTRPTDAMRQSMARAEVGDDTLDGDPTTRRLEERVAGLLGKEEALFFPSGIMANQAALAVLAPPGTEVVVEARAHVFNYEEAAAARMSGIQLRPVRTADGILRAPDVRRAIRPDSPYVLQTSVVALENTHMGSGGRVVPLDDIRTVASVAAERDVSLHLDGARLWHAAVASGEPLRELAAPADTVMVSLSKGLGAPVGSMLAGSSRTMEAVWRVRRRFGGGMRQTGILAAAALHALEHHRERLVDDHRNARRLADGLEGISAIRVTPPETNAVMVELSSEKLDPEHVLEGLRRQGVRLTRFGPRRLRAVTHLDVDGKDVEKAVTAFEEVLAGARE